MNISNVRCAWWQIYLLWWMLTRIENQIWIHWHWALNMKNLRNVQTLWNSNIKQNVYLCGLPFHLVCQLFKPQIPNPLFNNINSSCDISQFRWKELISFHNIACGIIINYWQVCLFNDTIIGIKRFIVY